MRQHKARKAVSEIKTAQQTAKQNKQEAHETTVALIDAHIAAEYRELLKQHKVIQDKINQQEARELCEAATKILNGNAPSQRLVKSVIRKFKTAQSDSKTKQTRSTPKSTPKSTPRSTPPANTKKPTNIAIANKQIKNNPKLIIQQL